MTLAPSSIKRRAIAAPNPRAAPLTIATLPLTLPITRFLHYRCLVVVAELFVAPSMATSRLMASKCTP
jgi:hypothetical protein